MDGASSEESDSCDAFSFENCTDESFLKTVLGEEVFSTRGIIVPRVDGHAPVNIPSIFNTQSEDQTTKNIEDDTTSQHAVQETHVPRNDKAQMDTEQMLRKTLP